MSIKLKIVGYEPQDPTSHFIEYWYDRHLRLWTIQVFTDRDVEVESQTIPKAWVKDTLEDLSRKYDTTDIRKV